VTTEDYGRAVLVAALLIGCTVVCLAALVALVAAR
jgi:hypothetical protein